jgi:hypothetical protein
MILCALDQPPASLPVRPPARKRSIRFSRTDGSGGHWWAIGSMFLKQDDVPTQNRE